MNYRLRFTPRAADELQWLLDFLAERDLNAALEARMLIEKSLEFLRVFPFACRKALPEQPFLRELAIGFGDTGFVALYEIESECVITVLAVRHQREDDLL